MKKIYIEIAYVILLPVIVLLVVMLWLCYFMLGAHKELAAGIRLANCGLAQCVVKYIGEKVKEYDV